MNLTKKIADLIDCGKAEYNTWTIGTTAAGLNIPKNKIAIILGIEAAPIDANENVNFRDVEYRLLSRGRIWSFMDRVQTGGLSIDTYIVVNDELNFNCFSGEELGYENDNDFIDTAVSQPGIPIGIGTAAIPSRAARAVKALKSRTFTGYIQKTYQKSKFVPSFGAAVWNVFKGIRFWNNRYPNPETLEILPGVSPLLTIHYVLINEDDHIR